MTQLRMKSRTLKLSLLSLLSLVFCASSTAAQNSDVAIFPLEMRGWMPVVEVNLNGQTGFHFMIDTGAGLQADIDPSVAERLKLQPTGIAINGDPSGENDRELRTVSISSLTIGGTKKDHGAANFMNITAVVRPQRITKDYPDVDGILGFPLFAEHLLTLDYPNLRVRLQLGALPPANGVDIINFEIENRIPVIELAIGHFKVPAHIDSGNFVAGFILPEEIVEQLQLLSQPVPVGSARSVNNRIELKQVQLRSPIRLGGFEYAQPTITFPALSDTNVGYKILREFTLTFDQKNGRLKLERPAGSG
jgi:aspartyl protease